MRKKLEELELEDFDEFPLWVNLFGNNDELEGLVEPVVGHSELSRNLDFDVLCRTNIELRDGSVLKGIAMYYPESGKIGNFSMKNDEEWLTIMLPPAPDFVLKVDGPESFAKKLNKPFLQVFPVTITTELKETKTGNSARKVINRNSKNN